MFLRPLPRFHNTLAFRLTVWYAGVFILSACLAFGFFYFFLTTVLENRTDEELLGQARRYSSLMSMQGMEALRRTAMIETQAAGEKKIFFRLLYPNGTVFGSSNMEYWKNIGIEKTAIRQLIQGNRHVFDTITLPDRTAEVRILYSVIGLGTILQLGQSMESVSSLLDAFNRVFVLTMSVLFVVAALIGWFMARQALAGVGQIRQTARQITAGSLTIRVPVKSRRDEIDQLAEAFNQMLDRIQTLITGIREMGDNIAHDLRSPITRIRGSAEITLTTESDLEAYQKMAADTIEECDRLLDIINTMLVISKTEAGADALAKEPLDIAEVVHKACELFLPMAEDQGVRLECHAENPAVIRGDVRMIQRMVANLIDNAIKYTPSGGHIRLILEDAPPDPLRLVVSDTGIGIGSEDLSHVFDRFFRCDPSRTTSGIGLGLSLSQTIAQAMGGNITVRSRPGKGSTFTVTLPRDPAATAPAPNATDSSPFGI